MVSSRVRWTCSTYSADQDSYIPGPRVQKSIFLIPLMTSESEREESKSDDCGHTFVNLALASVLHALSGT